MDCPTRNTQNTEELLLCAWDPANTTEEFMGRFVLSSSKGLAEVTKSMDRNVQFIHESVRDFPLKEHGLDELWAALRSPNNNERLKQCCYNYMKIIMSRESM
ncbi:hypothetical protein TWF103_003360 [Orbilia oligospora]|nr:hypothetical protein TWF103_003360 [Orbilia oligospora]